MFARRWSTFSLLVASLGVGAVAFYSGKRSGLGFKPAISPVTSEPVASDQAKLPLAMVTNPEPVAPAADFSSRWGNWQTRLRTPATERDAAVALQELARNDPDRAMKLALSEDSPRLQERFRQAVLKGWGSTDASKAANWALTLPMADRRQALVAVFSGAVEKPDEAALLGENLCRQLPVDAGDYGQLLISALTESGAFATAAHFAQKGDSDNRAAWLNSAYYQWAMRQPEQALKSFGAIIDPATRGTTFLGLAAGWAEANPAAVASYALRLPAGADRAEALGQMLAQWTTRDPLTASEWMLKNLTPSTDLDGGVAAVASLPSLVSQRPEIAIGWAESIANPIKRSQTLTVVAQLWSQRDPEGARRYIDTSSSLSSDERAALLLGLEAAH